uniref:Peptidase M12A domain-containing protein n=1 Tax=Globodera rostochiensis TaxID=31243 RepID=A0A914HR59_GLORO
MVSSTIERKIRIEREIGENATVRAFHHDVYLWPSLDDREKQIIRAAFEQIHRRTCIRFNELDYKPWYHAERWAEGKPYIVIRKSKKFSGYSDNNIENVNRRSLIYLSEKSLSMEHNTNTSRGLIMEQLVKFMGFREEFLRPDAPSYIQPIAGNKRPPGPSSSPAFANEQLMWPFDPESITVSAGAREWFKLSVYCGIWMGPCVVPRKPRNSNTGN